MLALAAIVVVLTIPACFEARDCPVDGCPVADARTLDGSDAGDGSDVGADGSDAGADGGSCEPVFVALFEQMSDLADWDPISLVKHHTDPSSRALPALDQGFYTQGVAPPAAGMAGGGHHRPLGGELIWPLQLSLHVRANHEVAGSEATVGLFESPDLHDCCNGSGVAAKGFACAWRPHERQVEVRLLPGGEIVAWGEVPEHKADWRWHDVLCSLDAEGRWALAVDGRPLTLGFHEPSTALGPLTLVSTYLSAHSEFQQLAAIHVLRCR